MAPNPTPPGSAKRLSFVRLLFLIAGAAALNQCKGEEPDYSPPVEVVPGLTAEVATLSSGWLTIHPPDPSNQPDSRPLAAFSNVRARTGGEGRAERDVVASLVTPNFFEVCREQALVGRMFGVAETGAVVAVLGYRIWSEHFGRSREIVGRGVRLNGQLYTVVGVAPQRFVFPESSDFWVTAIQTENLPSPVVIRPTAAAGDQSQND